MNVTHMILFAHWLPNEQRIEYKCHQAPIYLSELIFTLLLGSSALLQTFECSKYRLSEQSPVVSALYLTRLQLSGTNSLFLFVILPLSVLSNIL